MGPAFYHSGQIDGTDVDLDAQLVRLGAGCELSSGMGIVAGVVLEEVRIMEFSRIPVTAKLYWDFSPGERWRRGVAYVMATYNHTSFEGDESPYYPMSPSLDIGAGVAYTFCAITPKMEFRLRPGATSGTNARLLFGLDVGGNYVFGPAAREP